jgi:hypothetical protein
MVVVVPVAAAVGMTNPFWVVAAAGRKFKTF